jgi:hypothetical protein
MSRGLRENAQLIFATSVAGRKLTPQSDHSIKTIEGTAHVETVSRLRGT